MLIGGSAADLAAGIAANRAEAVRWVLARIREARSTIAAATGVGEDGSAR